MDTVNLSVGWGRGGGAGRDTAASGASGEGKRAPVRGRVGTPLLRVRRYERAGRDQIAVAAPIGTGGEGTLSGPETSSYTVRCSRAAGRHGAGRRRVRRTRRGPACDGRVRRDVAPAYRSPRLAVVGSIAGPWPYRVRGLPPKRVIGFHVNRSSRCEQCRTEPPVPLGRPSWPAVPCPRRPARPPMFQPMFHTSETMGSDPPRYRGLVITPGPVRLLVRPDLPGVCPWTPRNR